MEKRNLFRNDLFFNSDNARIARDIGSFDAEHKRSNVHPLFILFMTPTGSALARLTGSSTKGALILTSLIGGMSIALAGVFLSGAGLPMRRAILFTLILGFSAAHLFFGSLPETFSLSATSLILLFLLVRKRPGRFLPFLLAGLFSFGVLLTNLGVASLTYAVSCLSIRRPRREWEYVIYRILLLPFCIVIAAVPLVHLQKNIWPTTRPFYNLATYPYEARFMDPLSTVAAVVKREFLLGRHLFAYDWFAPALRWMSPRSVVMQTESLWTIEGWGRLALVIWFPLLLLSGYSFVRYRLYRQPLLLGLLACLLFNIVLHTKYGDNLFLYACNTCFLILSFVALCTNELRMTSWRSATFDLMLFLLLACEIANNQLFVRRILSVYTPSPLF